MQVGQIDSCVLIQGVALVGCAEQTLVRVLAVDVDKISSHIGELRHRRHPAVDIRAGSTIGRHHAGKYSFAGFVDETTFDAGLIRTGSHDTGVCPTTQQEPDCLDDHGLAGACLTSQRHEPGVERDGGRLDDTEVFDVQLGQHRQSPRPNFARTI